MELDRDTLATLEYSLRILGGESAYAIEELRARQISARCIEVPWVAHQLASSNPETILDVGISLASLDCLGILLDLKTNKGRQLEAVDIVSPERVLTRYPKSWQADMLSIPVFLGDLITLELPRNRYDVVTCISTLEHIGYDVPLIDDEKSAFARACREEDVVTERPADINVRALDAIHAVLKAHGRLILTVPMGKGGPVILRDSLGYYCVQWEFEKESWGDIVFHPGFRAVEQAFFRLEGDGRWMKVNGVADLSDQAAQKGSHSNGCALAVLEKIDDDTD